MQNSWNKGGSFMGNLQTKYNAKDNYDEDSFLALLTNEELDAYASALSLEADFEKKENKHAD